MNKLFFFIAIGLLSISCRTRQKVVTKDVSSFYLVKFHEGIRAQLNNDHEKAIDCFEFCIANEPNQDAPYFALHKTYSNLNKVQKSQEFMEKAYLIDQKNTYYLNQLYKSYERQRNYKLGADLMLNQIKKEPHKEEYYFKAAFCLSKSNSFKKAVSILNQLEKKIGHSPDIYIYRSGIWEEAKNTKNALNELKEANEVFPNDASILSYLTDYYVKNNQKEEAIKLLETLNKMNANNSNISLLLGNLYLEKGDSSKAFNSFKIALSSLDLDPMTSSDLFLNLKSIWTKDIEIVNLLESYVSIFPENPVLISILADYLIQTNQPLLALKNYKQVVELNPNLQMVWEEIMVLEFEFEQWESLAKNADKYTTLFPFSALGFYAKGIAEIESKKFFLAKQTLTEAKTNSSNNQPLRIEIEALLCEIEILTRDTASGLKCLEEIIFNNEGNLFILKRFLNLAMVSLNDSKLSEKLLNQFCKYSKKNIECLFLTIKKHISFEEYDKALVLIESYEDKLNSNNYFMELNGDYFHAIGMVEKAKILWEKSYNLGNRSDRIMKKLNRNE